MAPKAKAKVKAKAKAGGGVRHRRPAALAGGRRGGAPVAPGAGGRVRRRGGAHSWNAGRECALHDVRLEDFKVGQILEISDGIYYGEKMKVCGKLVKLEMSEGDHFHLFLRLLGTTSEALLKVFTSGPTELFVIHRCSPECKQEETGDRYVHGRRGRLVLDLDAEDGWMRNLETVVELPPERDDLRDLRDREKALAGSAKDPKEDKKEESCASSSQSSRKKDKRKKTKKKKDKSKEGEKTKKKEKEKKDAKLDGRHALQASIKEPEALFGGTGLSATEKVRRRVIHRAKKFVKKKKDKSSSSSTSSSEGSSSHEEDAIQDGVFVETSRARGVFERYPGVLTEQSLRAMRTTLLQEIGEDPVTLGIKPIAVAYYRQQLVKKLNGPASREALTLCMAMDLLLRGRACQAMDVLAQRLKSVEAVSSGAHWQVAQRMEVTPPDLALIAQPGELRGAQKESYEDSRTLWLASNPGGGKDKNKKGPKGDPRKGDGKKDTKDNPKGKGQGDKKDAK